MNNFKYSTKLTRIDSFNDNLALLKISMYIEKNGKWNFEYIYILVMIKDLKSFEKWVGKNSIIEVNVNSPCCDNLESVIIDDSIITCHKCFKRFNLYTNKIID